jgi:hypothetical protein
VPPTTSRANRAHLLSTPASHTSYLTGRVIVHASLLGNSCHVVFKCSGHQTHNRQCRATAQAVCKACYNLSTPTHICLVSCLTPCPTTHRVTPRANSKHLVALWDEGGWLRVLRENGTVRWSAHANTTLLAAAACKCVEPRTHMHSSSTCNGCLKGVHFSCCARPHTVSHTPLLLLLSLTDSTLLLGLGRTHVYVQSLRLNTPLRSYECTGLNGTRMLGAAFDPVRQYR